MGEQLEPYERICAYVELDVLRDNMIRMKRNLSKETKMLAVVKADGYGHGAEPIAKELESLWFVDGFAVAMPEEAFLLKRAGIKKKILVLGSSFPHSFSSMIEEEIRFTVFQEETAREINNMALKKGKKAYVHFKVDTGMSRIGARASKEGLKIAEAIGKMEGIFLEGIYTHFARADEKDKEPAKRQLHQFLSFQEKLRERGIYIPVCHCSNSAAILELKEANLDLVRAGIAMYGLWPSKEVDKTKIDLKPALCLKSHLIYIKEVEAGREISYGGTYKAKSPIRVGTIPVGYGDGYPRSLSNKGEVLICGKRARIIGRVCMDQCMVDLTDIPKAREGDEVTLIGKDGKDQITVEELGELSGRFNYEFVCGIGKRVPRVYIKDKKIVSTKDYFHDFS